ncbi:hypothetical protein NQ318_016868 [Aromia moschata]|uniref:Uncharacterized protein n=1 Tax=Aromia moschata TaxID=1265417 RepID=A0AAV8X4F6_9CUCU|nr:hypothetical protein NQ318_016868 [Aromia moschata]
MVLLRPEENQSSNEGNVEGASVKVKTPKRVLHFSDGVLEEYSTDEEEATLTWGPWVLVQGVGCRFFNLDCDRHYWRIFGIIFGITTPRYYFELEEYKKREEDQKKRQEAEQGWSQPAAATVSLPLKDISTTQPKTR